MNLHSLLTLDKLSLFQESVKKDDRILLFSQSLFTLNLIEDFLKRKKLTEAEVRLSELVSSSPQRFILLFRIPGSLESTTID